MTRNRRSFPALACLGALLLGLCAPASGTTVVALDAQSLVTTSSRIVHVTCAEVTCYRDSKERIVTRYRFDVAETLKGEEVTSFTCVQPGGQVGNLATLIPGLTSHEVGQESILFLGPRCHRNGFQLPVGLDQGVYRVITDPDTGQRSIRRDLSTLQLISPKAEKSPGNLEQLPETESVEAFKQEIRRRVQLQSSVQGSGR